jgi:hypothetical protein
MKSKLVIALYFVTSLSHAQVNFNSINYKGTGCPQGTVSTAVSPDGSTLSVLFDEFRAQVPQYDGNNDNDELPRGPIPRHRQTPTVAHKFCALSFTATLPAGSKVEALEIYSQIRGATVLDQGVEGNFTSMLLGYRGLAMSQGKPLILVRKNFQAVRAPIDMDWTETSRNLIPLNSGCAGNKDRDIRFDIKSHINLEALNGDVKKSGMIVVDSNDISGLLKFKLKTRPCGGPNGHRNGVKERLMNL